MNKLLLISIGAMLLFGCSNNTEQLEAKISQLEMELDNCKNGADKLLGKIKSDFENKAYKSVIDSYKSLQKQHPSSPEITEAKIIFDETSKIIENEEVERKKKEAERLALIEAEKAKKLASLKKLKKKHDDVSGITWYKQPYFTHYVNTNRISLDLGSKPGNNWVNLTLSYEGDDWIFFKKAYLSYDGNTQEIIFDDYKDKKTDNDAGRVYEWIEITGIDDSLIQFLEQFAKSPNAKMRFSGKYTKTRTISLNERKGITDVINGYRALESTLN